MLMLILCACPQPADGDPTPTDTVFVDSSGSHRKWGLLIEPYRIAAGDSIGPLRVRRADVQAAYDSTPVGTIALEGRLELTGFVVNHPEPDLDAMCFEAEPVSATTLPKWYGDTRRPWFCFENVKDARRKLSPLVSGRMYTVIISDFTIHKGMSDQVNGARLDTVLKHSP